MLLGSQILETAIGVLFVILMLSLVCTALNELIARVFDLRAKHLELGLQQLLEGKGGLFNEFIRHPLIQNLVQSRGFVFGWLTSVVKVFEKTRPTFVPSSLFSLTLTNILSQSLSPAIHELANHFPISDVAAALRDELSRAGDDLAELNDRLKDTPDVMVGATGMFLTSFNPENVKTTFQALLHFAQSLPEGPDKKTLLKCIDAADNNVTKLGQELNAIRDRNKVAQWVLDVINRPSTLVPTLPSISEVLTPSDKRAILEAIFALEKDPKQRRVWQNRLALLADTTALGEFVRELGDQALGAVISEVFLKSANEAVLVARMRQQIMSLTNPDLRRPLLALIDNSKGGVDSARKELEGWFDTMLGQVSGWYKRSMQLLSFVLGFAIAVLTNADLLNVGHEIYGQPLLRQAAVAAAQKLVDRNPTLAQDDLVRSYSTAAATLGEIGIPLGWKSEDLQVPEEVKAHLLNVFRPSDPLKPAPTPNTLGWLWWTLEKLVGWITMGAALSLGAPFWFDVLSKVVNLRAYGKPEAITNP